MSSHTPRHRVITCIALSLAAPFAASQVTPYSSDFVRLDGYSFGWSTVASPQGGHYVFQAVTPPTRPQVRFPIGKVQRDQFDLFSAEEEAALWATLRHLESEEADRELANVRAQKKQVRKRSVQAKAVAPRAKVVIRDGKVCVPEVAFSDSPDWRSHLVCTAKEQQ